LIGILAIGVVAAGATMLAGPAHAEPLPADAESMPIDADPASPGAVLAGERVAAEKACYVRLPDLPAPRFAGFGAYNAATGVLAYAGGAEKLADDITLTHYELFAIRLDGAATAWETIAYPGDVGYQRAMDRGCREMAGVRLDDGRWASVFGKDGCDNGRFDAPKEPDDPDESQSGDTKGGDIKVLALGADATRAGVAWEPNSGLKQLIEPLKSHGGRLSRPFAAYDTERRRIVVGQGTFDGGSEQDTANEVYAASQVGRQFQIKALRPRAAPGGRLPGRRHGACAAYVHQPETGTDGVLVVGGRLGETTYADAWWLDFSAGAEGTWVDVTARFTNMADYGARREGACAYDAATRSFYSWMGRVESEVPDGSSRSSGAWRVDLSGLGDTAAPLTWERLARDDLKGVPGRHMIPSVWDAANRRMLVLGGRRSLDAYADVWAIYPDVTGQACAALDPYAPYRDGPLVPTPTPPSMPTAAPPRPTSPAGGPAPDSLTPRLCASLRGRVPAAVLNHALANPWQVQGFGEPQSPNLPPGPTNPRRLSLTLRNPGLAWDTLFNPLLFRSGCS